MIMQYIILKYLSPFTLVQIIIIKWLRAMGPGVFLFSRSIEKYGKTVSNIQIGTNMHAYNIHLILK